MFFSARKDQYIRIKLLALSQPHNPMDGSALSGAYLRFAVPKHQFNLLIFLSDEKEREIYRLSRFYWREAMKCEEAKAFGR